MSSEVKDNCTWRFMTTELDSIRENFSMDFQRGLPVFAECRSVPWQSKRRSKSFPSPVQALTSFLMYRWVKPTAAAGPNVQKLQTRYDLPVGLERTVLPSRTVELLTRVFTH